MPYNRFLKRHAMRQYKALAVLIFLAIVGGCSSNTLDFTLISTKPIDLQAMASYQRQSTPFIQQYTTDIIILFPSKHLDINSIIDMTLELIPGAVALVDGSISHDWWWIPYIYGQNGYTVVGTALIDPSKLSDAESINQRIIARVDEAGTVASIEAVNEETFLQALDQ